MNRNLHSDIFPLFMFTCTLLANPVFGQNRIGLGEAHELYTNYCAACHGQNLEGGQGSSLIDDEWIHGSSDAEITAVIENGVLSEGMVGYKQVLEPEQIRSLVIYLQERKLMADREGAPPPTNMGGVFKSEHHDFRIEEVATFDGMPWAIDFLPNGDKLITEREGRLWILDASGKKTQITGIPEILVRGQGGLLEVGVHPDYNENGWIYLGYSGEAEDKNNSGMTEVTRGRIADNTWADEETIFKVSEELYLPTGQHFGTRFVFQDGYLFFGIGDRGRQQMAQDLSKPNGKVYRIYDDGRIPEDNPFIDTEGALKSIWSYGHRNPQGMDADPLTGNIWETEHGPRGGDETNLIHKGANYGWPVITYGMNYNGTPITDKTAAPGLEQPKLYWTPSIAVCGIDFYEGNLFPEWKNNLFVSGLSSQQLHRLEIRGDEILKDEIVLKGLGRVRDVASGPGGEIFLFLNKRNPNSGKLVRLVPAK